jgi:hypothetical protein
VTEAPEGFEMAEGYACCRLTGQVSFPEALDLLVSAIERARGAGIRKLLVDARSLTGFDPPSVIQRFSLGERAAGAARGSMQLALVCQPGMIEAERFGVIVARNRGLHVDVFAEEPEAVRWLLGQPAR